MKILVIDDVKDNVELLIQVLENYEVISATNGKNGIKLAKEKKPDLILLDVMMPDINGYEVMQELNSDALTKNIPVIFLSAHYRDIDRVIKGLELGAYDYLTKPIEDELLLAKVKNVARLKKTEEQLIKAKKKAEQTSNEKSIFLTNLSHEIRTPMNVIVGFTKLLSNSNKQLPIEQQQKYLNMIKVSSNSLLKIIDDILDLSKIEAGKLKLEYINFDIKKLINEAIEALSVINEKNIEIITNLDKDSYPYLYGDSNRLYQIFINILNNAVKFTVKGSVTVKVITEKETDKDIKLRFEIIDTGIGISKEDQTRLFKSFSQIDESHAKKQPGTGLGLAISKQLVELMGGEIGVESQKGVGSTFCFVMPFKKN